ncbi:DUF4232 domain-containing protein [Kutzneria buriramensis]|uniref:Uncharacterized protein DUF4232 n=1 Tax=Kutzneria buriramensis TaxID=1045776 RepID=A0A3E0GXA1_9PSEU|nr:DUF4232 domain-containing protein [Kutzneria buriramensis]REH32607.1 uncharacterized protein DUF4232 [Kutzneria buriramensis]
MKRAAVAVAVLAAGGFLGACGVNADVTPTGNATGLGAGARPVSATKGDSRCASTDLSLSVGTPKKHDDVSGQLDVPLTFKNISAHTCALYGVPDVSLIGPDDPNGTTYQLIGTDNGVQHNDVEPGMTATATVTVLQPGGDSVGSMGSKTWTPTKVQATPPGQQQALTAAWPSSVAVLRQDSATHPGTFVNGILADPA